MDFSLSQEQALIRDTFGRFLGDRYGFDTRRKVLAGGEPWRPEIWAEMAELGLLGALVPVDSGGMGGGGVELMLLMEQLGEALVVEPFLETAVVAPALLRGADGAAGNEILPRIAAGEVRTALAWMEPTSRYNPRDVLTRAARTESGWILDGAKAAVSAAPLATHLIFTARTSGGRHDREGVSLFLAPVDAAGVQLLPFSTLDDRTAADIDLRGVRVDEGALVGAEGAGLAILEGALDVAVAAICAEAVGAMRRLVADTVAYSKQRRQFGQPIGSFQVLQHRMVDMYIALQEAISAVYLAVLKLDEAPAERARATSAAKVTICRTSRFIGQNAVQIHGAMGMTDELPVGHYFKRLTVIENELGGADYHLARYAALAVGARTLSTPGE